MSDAVISVQGNSYTIHAGEFLQSIHTGEKYTVEYQVVITDESVIGKEIHNHVIVRSDNCEEKEDEEKVEVEEPKEEPEEPKEEPPKEPEEPEEPKEAGTACAGGTGRNYTKSGKNRSGKDRR